MQVSGRLPVAGTAGKLFLGRVSGRRVRALSIRFGPSITAGHHECICERATARGGEREIKAAEEKLAGEWESGMLVLHVHVVQYL